MCPENSRSLQYKAKHPNQLQCELGESQKKWIDAHSTEELKADLKRAAYGMGVRASSQYRGVSRIPDSTLWPWRATQYLIIETENGQQHVIWTQSFKDEESAARAWDRVAVQYCGRCCAVLCRRLHHDTADVKSDAPSACPIMLSCKDMSKGSLDHLRPLS